MTHTRTPYTWTGADVRRLKEHMRATAQTLATRLRVSTGAIDQWVGYRPPQINPTNCRRLDALAAKAGFAPAPVPSPEPKSTQEER